MSERKKLKTSNVSQAKKLYESLRLMQSQSNSTSPQEYIQPLMSMLIIPQARSYGIMALAELVRVSGSTSILTPSAVMALFEALYEALISEDIALDTFIDLRIPSCLRNRKLILKFFDLAKRTDIRNMKYLKQILVIFIEENEDRKEYVDLIIKSPNTCGDMIKDIHKYIDVNTLTEDEYLRLFCDNECIRVGKGFRAVRGRKRLYFVQKAIDSHYQDVMESYIKDKDKRVRVVLAERVTMMDEKLFRILLNDHEEDVRLAVLRKIKWSSSLLDISERFLDRSYNVRREMARIYNEGLFRLRQLPIFKKDLLKVGRLNFDGSGRCDELSKDYEIFMKFVARLFEGCLTIFKDEYIQIIKESNFTLDFLAEHQNCAGAHALFSTMEITTYSQVPRDLREFCLKYLYKGTLSDKEIMAAIEDNIFAVLRFIKDSSIFFSALLEKAMLIHDLESVELITESIKHLLSKNTMIESKKDIRNMILASDINSMKPVEAASTSASFEFDSPNLYFINAHTKCDFVFIEQQYGKSAYHHLYFLVHQLKNDPRIPLCIRNCTLTTEQKIRLLLYLDNPEALSGFADLLIKHNLEPSLQNILISKKTLTASLIYFLCTGLVCVKSSSFFVRCIKSAAGCNSPERVKWIFDKYVRAVDQETFDVFYSICQALKEYSTLGIYDELTESALDGLAQEDSIILNPKISDHSCIEMPANSQDGASLEPPMLEITTALPTSKNGTVQDASSVHANVALSGKSQPSPNPSTGSCKLKLTKADKMLHFICDFVIGSRKGTFTVPRTNFSKYGFFKMNKNRIEMIEHGQVVYE